MGVVADYLNDVRTLSKACRTRADLLPVIVMVTTSPSCSLIDMVAPCRTACRMPSASLVADKGYDTAACRDQVRACGAVPLIPSRRNSRVKQPIRRKTCAGRHVLENFFARLKDFRRVSFRCDKSDATHWGFVMFAAALLNMRLGWT